MASANQAMEETRKQQAEQKLTQEAVAEALAKTEIAQQKLPESTELAQAVTSLKTKLEQLAGEAKAVTAQLAQREAAIKTAADAIVTSQQAVDAATARLAALNTTAQTCEQAAGTAEQQIGVAIATVDQARQNVAERASVRAAAATLKPLPPEQLAWSMMQAAGVVDRERAAVSAEWDKNHPTPDAAALAGKARDVEVTLNEKLKGNVAPFISTFAGAPGQPQQVFAATADQALFLANGGQVRGWLAPADGNLIDRLVKLEDANAFASELYLSVMSRTPTADETKEVADYMGPRKADRPAAVAELAWALFCSSEFRFNH
jgi:excinuclease UvrABC ATPase subunit